MNTRIYWFRNDLRLHDNQAYCQAAAQASKLLSMYSLTSAVHNGDAPWED